MVKKRRVKDEYVVGSISDIISKISGAGSSAALDSKLVNLFRSGSGATDTNSAPKVYRKVQVKPKTFFDTPLPIKSETPDEKQRQVKIKKVHDGLTHREAAAIRVSAKAKYFKETGTEAEGQKATKVGIGIAIKLQIQNLYYTYIYMLY